MPAILGNTSASGGYLAPISPPPADDLALDVQLQQLLVGLTGLPGDHVLPRVQDGEEGVRPRLPDVDETWVSVGVTEERPADTPALIHNGAGEGSSVLRSTSYLEVLASFYGPRSDAYARLVQDGLWLAQNREAMLRQGLQLVDVGTIRRAPEIIANRARRKSDLPISLVRTVERTYRILNVTQAVGTIHAADIGPATPSVTSEPFTIPET